MSRLAVLQLAPSATDATLRAHFQSLDLPITDAKVVYKRTGVSRGIGFIGYKTAEDAERAKLYFNGTYFEGRRIKVDVAQDVRSFLQEPPRKRIKVDHVPLTGGDESQQAAIPMQDVNELDDAAYLAARKKRKIGEVSSVQDEEGATQEAAPEIQEQTEPPSRLFLRNLPFSVTEDDLREAFEAFGELSETRLIVDQSSGVSKGLAYLTFGQGEDATKARAAMDGTPFHGRLLHILPAIERSGVLEERPARGVANGSVKKQRDTAKKGRAGLSTQWASLYLNADAVAQAAAAQTSSSKSDIIGRDAQDPAVRLALAETALVAETTEFLQQQGIETGDVTTRPTRSDTMLLVKNLPFATTAAILEPLFSAQGALERLVLSPSGLLAIVEYKDAKDASTAMRNVAYRRVGKAPIYLEPAPLSTAPRPSQRTNPDTKVTNADETSPKEVSQSQEADATLYLKNLAWATTDDLLVNALRHLPGFVFARVQTKDDPKRTGQKLSMGFGFAGFRSRQEAENALPTVHGLMVDGHALQATFARRDDSSAESRNTAAAGERASAKVIVKNLAFEATKKEIRELCSAHASVKSVRMPRKADRGTRGFAFVEFASKRDAQLAIAALAHTHLLGRHLVFEYATDQVSEQKVAEESRRMLDQTSLPHKKSRMRGVEADLAKFGGANDDE